jgi:hypothetical protein
MKALSLAALAALNAPEAVTVQLVRMGFAPTPVALAASTWTITHLGLDYKAAQGLGTISPIEDAPGTVKGVQFEITGAPAEYIALAMDDADQYQGVPISISTALLDPVSYQIVDVLPDWVGRGDTFTHTIEGQTASIQATAESSEVDLLRGNPLTTSDADQQTLYPGDRAFEYVVAQADQRDVWPSREYFFK